MTNVDNFYSDICVSKDENIFIVLTRWIKNQLIEF